MHETRLLKRIGRGLLRWELSYKANFKSEPKRKFELCLCERWTRARVGTTKIEQLRAARGLLGWSQTELGKRAGLSLPTVKRVETGKGARVSEKARAKLQSALEAAGVIFIEENGGGPGVRLRKDGKIKSGRK